MVAIGFNDVTSMIARPVIILRPPATWLIVVVVWAGSCARPRGRDGLPDRYTRGANPPSNGLYDLVL
jgi:hypothetical protein